MGRESGRNSVRIKWEREGAVRMGWERDERRETKGRGGGGEFMKAQVMAVH